MDILDCSAVEIPEAVELFIQLRNRKRDMTAAHEARIAELDAAMKGLEARVHTWLAETGQKSARFPSGTATRTNRRRVNVAAGQWDAFFSWVRTYDRPDLLTRSCSSKEALAYLDAEGTLPPGLRLDQAETLSVRIPTNRGNS